MIDSKDVAAEGVRSTFTPGPWEVVEHSWQETGIYDTTGHRIASLRISDEEGDGSDEDVSSAQMLADARLISAAPELLAALRQYVACDSIKGDGLAKMAQAAIAKATLEPT